MTVVETLRLENRNTISGKGRGEDNMRTRLVKRVDPDAEALAEIRALYRSETVEATGWMAYASCRAACGVDPDLHHPTGDESSPLYRSQATVAKQMCAGCPVRETCLAHALQAGEPDGIWGGMTPDERRAYRRDQVQRSHDAAALQPEIVTTEVTDTQSSELAEVVAR